MKALDSFYLKLKRFFSRRNSHYQPARQINLDQKLVYSLSKSRIPKLAQIKYIKKFLNPNEAWLIRISFLVIILSLTFMSARFYVKHLENAPASGGEYTEALIGNPKNINPLYAGMSDVDSDISSLVFSSLLKYDGNGQLSSDLADSYEIGADNKSYIFNIRKDVKWQDGSPLTADDVIFTFRSIKDEQYKSPLRSSYAGVSIDELDDHTVKFTLNEAYAPFPELATFGIMPQHLWSQVPPQSVMLTELDIKPVGSGPYKFKSLTKDKFGQVKSYTLAPNPDYYGATPHIEQITFKFFAAPEEAVQALNDNQAAGLSYLPKKLSSLLAAKNSYYFDKLNMPELTAVFLNQKNNTSLADVKVRQALAYAINKDAIVQDVLGGDGRAINGPILPENYAYNPDVKNYPYSQNLAAQMLDESGWKITEVTAADIAALTEQKNENKLKAADEDKLAMGEGKWRYKDKFLVIKLTTVETDENMQAMEKIKGDWEALGIKVALETVSTDQIQNDTIRPRNFEAFLYGQVVGNDPDVYPFWHSTQGGELGANLSGYSNKEVDQLLEDARLTTNVEERKDKYKRFQEIIATDEPAIFLYSPVYTYVQSKDVKGFSVSTIESPKDRFSNILDWYIKTKRRIVW